MRESIHSDNDHFHSDPENWDYVQPQMSYCCGSRGLELSPSFQNERTRCVFVSLAFAIKLIQLTFISFVVYDLAADEEGQIKFNLTLMTLEQLKEYNWILFVAAALVISIYFAARCGGVGRGFCSGLFLNVVKTFCTGLFCGALLTTDLVYPSRYIVVLVVVTLSLISLGICLLTTLFEMNVLGRGMYSALFLYFLVIFLFSNFLYASTLREKYKFGYALFITNCGIGGGVGLFIGMVMFWYIQQLIMGKVISLHESDTLYVNLLF